MSRLIILGSSSAIPSLEHENTHLAILRQSGIVLIDCPGNPINRLTQAGLDTLQVEHLVLTHFHPDHISGAPSLLMQSWLMGRKTPLDIYGLAYTLNRLKKMMRLYEWQTWPDFFPVRFHQLPEVEFTPVLKDKEIQLTASPVQHIIPTIGLRVDFIQSGKSLAYSCDTEPCQAVARLGEDVDILIHEATGAANGHSSASQAGQIAAQAQAKRLALIHYPTHGKFDPQPLLQQAAPNFLKTGFPG